MVKSFPEKQRQELEKMAEETQASAYAKGTLENLKIQWALYQNFCNYFNYQSLPMTQVLVTYIQFLMQKLRALSSIRNYVAGVKTLHELLELNREAFTSIRVKLMWMGLHTIFPDTIFWAICLTAFFILARKSNLMPVSKFEPHKQLCSKHVQFSDGKVHFTLHWSKTRRPHQDPIKYSLHYIPGSSICPFEALSYMFNKIPCNPEQPCFMFSDGSPFTYSMFMNKLRSCLQSAGYQEGLYSSHSFRSGGANFAQHAGGPPEMIQALGVWKSDAYLGYLEPTD